MNKNQDNYENKQDLVNNSGNVRKELPSLNLSEAQQTELRSHFDVVRKLAYMQNINSLVSISEVKINFIF